MAGFAGKKKRAGSSAPSSSSSSACVSTLAALIFLAFCVLGVWMLTSSSSSSSVRVARTSLRSFSAPDKPFDDTPGELPEDAIKEDLPRKEPDDEEEKSKIESVVDDEEDEERRKREEAANEEEERRKREEAANEEEERRKREEAANEEEEERRKREEAAVKEEEERKKQQEAVSEEEEKQKEEMSTEGDAEKTVAEEIGESRQLEDTPEQVNPDEEDGERRKESSYTPQTEATPSEIKATGGRNWDLCNTTAGTDYIPCLDNEKALKTVHITGHYEHRERHCPQEGPSCLVPLPKGYRRPIEWPRSREKIWYNNVPHTKLAEVKGHQNWVKVAGEYLNFPGGGTQFIHGALHYIDFIQKAVPRIAWGKHTRVILDVGCGVASFGGFLFERDVLAMSFAPKDEHEAQVQFALERGIPAISAVMGTQRLPFPSRVFDIVHCARCRVPWHIEGGRLLLELNRVLRPGGYFVWSATPVYQKLDEDVGIWKAMSELTTSMCWDLVTIKKDRLNSVGAAVFRKPVSNECYDGRKDQTPPMCPEDDDSTAAWYVPLQTCMHRAPIHSSERGSQWPAEWPSRLHVPPYWLNNSEAGVYGKPAIDDFTADYKHWKKVFEKSYLNGMGISWSKIRNVMDMKAIYGGFAAALKDHSLWVMNVVNIDSQDTLPIIYERGLFGIYHDWCESFSTYPRTYDLLHADHLFSGLKKRCDILPVVVEVDRILRPGGTFIIRDESAIVNEVENLLKSLHWDVRMTFTEGHEGIICAEKTDWRPETFSSSS